MINKLMIATPKASCFREWMQLLKQSDHQRFLTLQLQFHELTKQLVYQKRKNHSSCIARMHCKRIMKSIDYTIDHALFDDALQALQTTALSTLYEQGMDVLIHKLKEIKNVHTYLIGHILPFYNERYQNVLNEQIPHFIKYYEEHDRFYAAYTTHDDFDYPLLDGLPLMHENYHLRGVDLVWEYCRRMMIEQQYIEQFSILDLQEFIRCYEIQKGIKIEMLGCNLCEILFTQYAFCSYFPKKHDLIFHEDEYNYLSTRLMHPKTALEHVYQIVRQQYSNEIASYLLKYKHTLYLVFEQIQQFNNLESLCILYQTSSTLQLQLIPSCNPAIYDELIKDLSELHSTDGVLLRLQQTPLSVYDYCDIFNSYLLDQSVLTSLFQSFDASMTAILFFVSFQDDLAFDMPTRLNLSFIQTLDTTEEWQTIFLNQLITRSEIEFDKIKQVIQQLRKSTI